MYKAGNKMHYIETKFDMSRRIMDILKEAGVYRSNRSNRSKSTSDEINAMLDMYKNGMSSSEIAEKLNIPYGIVQARVTKAGLRIPKKRKRYKKYTVNTQSKLKDEISKMYNDRISPKEIAKRLNIGMSDLKLKLNTPGISDREIRQREYDNNYIIIINIMHNLCITYEKIAEYIGLSIYKVRKVRELGGQLQI